METTLIELKWLWVSLKQDNFVSGTHVGFLCPFKGIDILIFIYLAICGQDMVYLEISPPPMQQKTLRGLIKRSTSPVFLGRSRWQKRKLPSLNFLLFLPVWPSVPTVSWSVLIMCMSCTHRLSVSHLNSTSKLHFRISHSFLYPSQSSLSKSPWLPVWITSIFSSWSSFFHLAP